MWVGARQKTHNSERDSDDAVWSVTCIAQTRPVESLELGQMFLSVWKIVICHLDTTFW